MAGRPQRSRPMPGCSSILTIFLATLQRKNAFWAAPTRWSLHQARSGVRRFANSSQQRWGRSSAAGHPLEVAARRIHEDLVVMERRNGAWVMTAGVVSSTRWRPSEKIGRMMAVIHEPVPC